MVCILWHGCHRPIFPVSRGRGAIGDQWTVDRLLTIGSSLGAEYCIFNRLGGGQRDWRGAGVRYCTHKITNAVAEGMNSKIMLIKRHAGGFRNRENFKTAIFFHCGVLSLDPQ
ncbi:MAG: transposase [Planctomyces sp.]